MKVVIIGSGIAGLTAGGYLSKVGYEVYVIEQFSEIGGVTATMSQDGFRWDLGPLILEGFGSGERAYKILADLGVADRIPTMLGDRNYVFPDFKLWKPKTYQGPLWRRELLEKIFPDEVGGLNRYLRENDGHHGLKLPGQSIKGYCKISSEITTFTCLSERPEQRDMVS